MIIFLPEKLQIGKMPNLRTFAAKRNVLNINRNIS